MAPRMAVLPAHARHAAPGVLPRARIIHVAPYSTAASSALVDGWTPPAIADADSHTADDVCVESRVSVVGGERVVQETDIEAELLIRLAAQIEEDPAFASKIALSMRLRDGSLQELAAACAVAESSDPLVPTRAQYRQVFVASAMPFLGFGIMDNAVMIVFGDVIDATLCATLGFSTMAAAALGNTFSDGIGVFAGAGVEDMAVKAGFEPPMLSRAQQAMGTTKHMERMGQLWGITVGCLIGMFPLLLLNTGEGEAKKREKVLEHMYEHVVVAVQEILDADAAMLVFVADEEDELHTHLAAHHGDNRFEVRAPRGSCVMGRVAKSGRFLNVHDIRAPESAELYVPAQHDDMCGTGIEVRSILCMPVFGHSNLTGHCDKVVAVVAVVNKKGPHSAEGFGEGDEDALAALAAHVSTSMSFAHGDEHGFDETIERCAGALRAKGTRINAAQAQRVHDLYSDVLTEVCKMSGAHFAQLHSVDASAGDFRCLATSADGGQRQAHAVDRSHSLRNSIVMAEAVDKRAPCTADDGSFSATLCCPIMDKSGEVIGAVRVVCDSGTSFDQGVLRRLEETCAVVASTMEGPGSRLGHLLESLRDGGAAA